MGQLSITRALSNDARDADSAFPWETQDWTVRRGVCDWVKEQKAMGKGREMASYWMGRLRLAAKCETRGWLARPERAAERLALALALALRTCCCYCKETQHGNAVCFASYRTTDAAVE